LADRSRTSVAFDQIVKVQQATHRVRRGALVGLVSGLAIGTFAANAQDSDDVTASSIGVFAGVGAAAGASIGALRNVLNRQRDVIYDSRRGTMTVLAPILSPTRKGLAFSMTWR
jgi:hypothetical protein